MTFNITNIKQELLNFLRNQDIMSVSDRGVTTTSQSGTLSSEDTITIEVSNVKNIRSITVDSISKYLGTDYTINFGNGTSDCVITFISSQTGDYSVSYDYGSDKIYDDYPRDDLTISSYPRIAVLLLGAPTEPFGIGGTDFISELTISVIVFANKTNIIDSYIDSIRTAFKNNAKNFYYLGFVSPSLMGPLINSPDKNDEIMQRNQDFVGRFNIE